MPRHYLFFVRDRLPSSEAHLIQMVQCANAAANLGYATRLAYIDQGQTAWQPHRWINPPLQSVNENFARSFNLEPWLRLQPLAMPKLPPWLLPKLTHPSTLACKYYWPLYLRRRTALVHTRDWNFVKAALTSKIPVIYECDHFVGQPFDPVFAQHPLLQAVVTVVDTVKDNLLSQGMPPDKVLIAPNGFNRQFLARHPEAAAQWRQRLLTPTYEKLVVYSGALYPFKGVDLLLEIAPQFPKVKFAIAGGPPEQHSHYQQVIAKRQLTNVALLGALPQRDLAHLLQAADALAHPHRLGDAATFTSPMKLFDYLAAGTPVVATRIPSLAQWPLAAKIAAWCEPNQPQAFADSLRQVLAQRPRPAEGFMPDITTLASYSWEARIKTILAHVEAQYCPSKF